MEARNSFVCQYVEGHADHDPGWMVINPGANPNQPNLPGTCMACVMVLLEDPSILTVKKKLILSEMLRVLGYHGNQMESVLASDVRVTAHAALLLLDLMKGSDATFVAMAGEALVQLLCLCKSEEVVCCVLDSLSQQCLKVCNYRKSVPVFNLVGKLMDAIPPLAGQLLHGYASFLDYVCAGLEYPDDEVQGSLSYILMMVYSSDVGRQMSASLSQRVARGVIHILMQAHSEQLQLNGLGLLRSMLEVDSVVEIYMRITDGPSLPAALKKLLLLKHEMLPVAVVQSVTKLLQVSIRGQAYAGILLQQDMAEFLFEALTTSNELLLGSLFCCLSLFADTETFFSKCHAVYGIESMLRAVEQAEKLKSPHVLASGLALLAKILSRPPGSVRLFSHAGLICQCLRLLAQTVDHHDHNVYLQAVKVLYNLVRRDHLLSTVLYSDIMQPLEVLTMSMAQYPRMHCRPADGKHDGKKATNKTLHAGTSQTNRNAVRAFITQQRILTTLSVLRQACRLAEVCLREPLADTSSFTQQKDSDLMLREFIKRLLQICDEICMPAILGNLSYLSDCAVFEHLYGTLNLLIHLSSPAAGSVFVEKLIAAGFVSVTVSLKSTVRATGADDDEIAVFLYVLWKMTAGIESTTSYGDFIQTGLQQLQGGLPGLVSALKQNSAEPADNQLRCIQWASLSIIHLMFNASDCPLKMEVLHDVLLTYLDLHCNQLVQLPPPLLRQLVFLLASSSPEKPQSFTHGESILLELLKQDPTSWWSAHPALLWWCFSSKQVTQVLSTDVVSLWLMEKDVEEENRVGVVAALAQKNDACLHTVLHLLVGSSDTLTVRCTAVLKEVILTKKDSDGADLTPIHRQLSENVLRMLLIGGDGQISEKLSILLELLCKVTQTLPSDTLKDVDLKLAFHVSKIISKNQSRSEDLDIEILNYLVCILVHSANQAETQVASVLLTNQCLMKLLVDHVTRGSHTAAVSLLALLLDIQQKHQVESQTNLELDTRNLLQGLTSHRSAFVLGTLQLWSSWLKLGCQQQFLTIRSHQKPNKDIYQTAGIVSDHDISLLVINIQQALLQEGTLVPDAAVDCLQALFQYLQSQTHLIGHFVGHPWMNMLARVAFSRQEGKVPPSWFLQFCILMMKHGGRPLNEKQLLKLAHGCAEYVDSHPIRSWLVSQLLKQAQQHNLLPANEEGLSEISECLQHLNPPVTGHKWESLWLDDIIVAVRRERSSLLETGQPSTAA